MRDGALLNAAESIVDLLESDPSTSPSPRLSALSQRFAALTTMSSAPAGSRYRVEPEGNLLQVSPTWLLAAGWQTGAFSCGGYGAPWSTSASDHEGGCYNIESTTHWLELIRLFPEQFSEEDWPGWIQGDAPERSAMALVQAVYAGHMLLRRASPSDPDAWLAQATDPLAPSRVAAFLHHEGPWSATASTALADCPDNLLDCAEGDRLQHVEGVEAKVALLSDAECFDDPISDADLDAFLEGVSAMWPDADWVEARDQALQARSGAGFATDGPAIIKAITSVIGTPLSCPAETLWEHYRYSCY